jgi:hypothetical protein
MKSLSFTAEFYTSFSNTCPAETLTGVFKQAEVTGFSV